MSLRATMFSGLSSFYNSIWFGLTVIAMVFVLIAVTDTPEEISGPLPVIEKELCVNPILQRTKDRCIEDHPEMFSEEDRLRGPSTGSDPLPFDVQQMVRVASTVLDPNAVVRASLPTLDDTNLYGL